MELYSVKYSLRLLSGKMFVLLEKVKSLKPEFNMEMSEFAWFAKEKLFDWQCEHIF